MQHVLLTFLLLFSTPSPLSFPNVKVEGNNGQYIITGIKPLKNASFFYSVEDGHNEFIHEAKLEKNKIEVRISKSKLPKNGTLILNLYEKANNGEMIFLYPVVLDKLGY